MYTQNQIDIVELELDLEFYNKCLQIYKSQGLDLGAYIFDKVKKTEHLLNECYAKEK